MLSPRFVRERVYWQVVFRRRVFEKQVHDSGFVLQQLQTDGGKRGGNERQRGREGGERRN